MDDIFRLFLQFTIYSFLGWLCESVYCSVPARKFINRGFLNGPFCPIYGAGGLLVIAVLSPFRDRIGLLFAAAVVLTTALEYLTGLALEGLFHAKYWDYSKNRFNFQGRICLQNSLLFGAMSVFAVRWLYPAMLAMIDLIPPKVLPAVSISLAGYFALDTALTVFTVLKLNGKLDELQQVLDEIREKAAAAREGTLEAIQDSLAARLDEAALLREKLAAPRGGALGAIQQSLAEKLDEVTELRGKLADAGEEALEAIQESLSSRLDEAAVLREKLLYARKELLESGFHLLQRRLLRAFPTMQSIRNRDSLQRTRELLENRTRFLRRK